LTTQPELDRLPTPDEAAGMAWWNSLGNAARGYWLSMATGGTVADAYAAFKHDQASVNAEKERVFGLLG